MVSLIFCSINHGFHLIVNLIDCSTHFEKTALFQGILSCHITIIYNIDIKIEQKTFYHKTEPVVYLTNKQ